MKWPRIRRMLLRGLLGLLLLGGAFMGVALLPGEIEGNYVGMGARCMCCSTSFMNFREGRMISYFSGHPPAGLLGRYQKTSDAVEIYWQALRPEEEETLYFRAYPRFLVTKFVRVEDGEERWFWKWPGLGPIAKSLETQEIRTTTIQQPGMVKREIFGPDLKPLRTETKLGKNPWVEQPAAPGGDQPPN